MRIRKHASRLLLGAQSVVPPPSLPPSSSSTLPSGLHVCKLNCSPWDLLVDVDAVPKRGQEEKDKCVTGNCDKKLKEGEEEQPVAVTATTNTGGAAEIKIEEEEKSPIHREPITLIGANADDAGAKREAAAMRTRYCNKKGKGWHCSRPAEAEHSFCSHHLTKHRAYLSARSSSSSSNHSNVNNTNIGAVNGRKSCRKRTSDETAAAADPVSNSYYYYDGFGPWRGKRSGTEADHDDVVKAEAYKAKEEGEIMSDLPVEQNNDNGSNNNIDEKRGEGIKHCSKRGKGWHCTRPAKLPHPFCDYHLTILRSYVSGRKGGKKKTPAASDHSDSYCNYGGIQPWQGKRRGGGDVKVKREGIEKQQIMDCDDDKSDFKGKDGGVNNEKDRGYNLNLEEEEIAYCRKTDGRGWHCKRPAQLPHSYCSHHLAQIRAYSASSNHSNKQKHQRKKSTGIEKKNSLIHVVHDDHKQGEEGSRETDNGKAY